MLIMNNPYCTFADSLGMRVYFCYFLIALIVYLIAWRIFIQGKPPAWISATLVVCVLLPTGWMEFSWQQVEHYGAVASKVVSGNPDAEVKCQRISETFFDTTLSNVGHVDWATPNVSHLDYKQCKAIQSWLKHKENPSDIKEIQALHVLTHEAVHVSGEKDEAITECTAINRDALLVQALGGSPEIATAIAQTYFHHIYPRMKSSYRLDGCSLNPAYDSILVKEEQEKQKKLKGSSE